MVTVVSNYCQLSQTQLSQTFAEKFTVTEELLQSLKKTALSGDEESIELLHNIALGYDEFGKKAEDILYHIVRNPTNDTLSIIRLIKNACLKLYNLAHTATIPLSFPHLTLSTPNILSPPFIHIFATIIIPVNIFPITFIQSSTKSTLS